MSAIKRKVVQALLDNPNWTFIRFEFARLYLWSEVGIASMQEVQEAMESLTVDDVERINEARNEYKAKMGYKVQP